VIAITTALARLALTGVDAKRDAQLARLIEAATATLGRELAMYLGLPAETVEIKAGGVPFLVLYDEPAADTIDEVAVATRTRPTAPWTTVDPDEYVVEGRALRHGDRWPDGIASVRITYTRGYAVDAGPAELRELVAQMVAARWESLGSETLKSESIGDYSYTASDLAGLADWPVVASRWRRTMV
jgi:hypothetical protein